MTKTEITNLAGFYSISYLKEENEPDPNNNNDSSRTMTEIFENDLVEIYSKANIGDSYWDENCNYKIGLKISVRSFGVSTYVYYCKIGSSYYEIMKYVATDDPNYAEQPNQANIDIMNNKYVLKEEYVELDKSYFDYIVACLSSKSFFKSNMLSSIDGEASFIGSYGLSENESEKALIKQLYGDAAYKYTFEAYEVLMDNENVIQFQVSRTRLIAGFEFGNLERFDFSSDDSVVAKETNNFENVLATERVEGYVGGSSISIDVTRTLDNRFLPKNDNLSTINCVSFNFKTDKSTQYYFSAPTSVGEAKNVSNASTSFSFSNTFEEQTSIVKNKDEVLTYAETVPTGLPAGVTFEGWYYDTEYTHPALVANQSLKTTGSAKNITLYAKYSNLPTITLDADGGSLAYIPKGFMQIVNNKTTLRFYNTKMPGENGRFIIEPVKAGFEFEGWYISTDAEQDVNKIKSMKKTENLTLKAKWAQQYIVKLQTNCDCLAGAYLVKAGEKIDELPNYLDNPGKIFDGWYLDSELTTKVDDEGYTCVGANKTLYAKFVDGVTIDVYTKYNADQDFSKLSTITTPKEQPQNFGKFYYELYNRFGSTNLQYGQYFAGLYTDAELTQPYTAFSEQNTSLYVATLSSKPYIEFQFGRNKTNKDYDNLANYLAPHTYSNSVNLGYTVELNNANDLFLYNPNGISKDLIKVGTAGDDNIQFQSFSYVKQEVNSENEEELSRTYQLTINGFYFDKVYNPDSGTDIFSQEWTDADSFSWYDANGKRKSHITVYVDYTIAEIEVG